MRATPLVFVMLLTAIGSPILYSAAAPPQALSAYDGRPEFSENSERSYFVWRDGDTWHVRWTTLGAEREFTGSVRAIGGELKDLKRIDVDEESKIVRRGRPARVVRGPRGRVVGVTPGRGAVVATRTEDHIVKVDERLIRWNAKTDDIDGFNFKVDNVEVLHFDLKITGESRPQSVEIGKANAHPRDNPFNVRLR